MLLHVHKHTVAHHFSFRSKFLIRWARTKQYELYISGITLKSHTTLSGKKDSSVNVLFLPEEYLKGCWEWLEVIIGVNLSPHTTTIVIINADLAKHLQKTTASNHIHLKLSPRTTVPGPQQQCEWKTFSTHFFFLNSKHLCQETHKEKTANPLGNMFFHKSSSPKLTYLHNKVIWYYQLSWWSNLATVKSFKADVSSANPSSERMTIILKYYQPMYQSTYIPITYRLPAHLLTFWTDQLRYILMPLFLYI